MPKLLPLFLLASLTAYGQALNSDITSVKTDKHVNIPSTHLYIIPPPGFEVTKGVNGLKKDDASIFMIQELIGGNFYTNAATFNRAKMEAAGAKVFEYSEIKINEYPAKFLSMEGDNAMETLAFVFGDSTFSVMIFATNPVDDKKTEEQIIESFKTIVFDKERSIDPFENAPFTVNDKKSKFKFCRAAAGIFFYALECDPDPKKLNGGDKAFVIIAPFPGGDMNAKEVASMMINKMTEHGFKRSKTKNETSNKKHGLDTYEGEHYGQLNGKQAIIFEYVLVKGQQVVTLQGIATNDMDENIRAFRELAHEMKLKGNF